MRAMWELIEANRRKTAILFSGMAFCLLVLGAVIGAALQGPEGLVLGILVAFIVWAFLSLLSYASADSVLLGISNAKEVSHAIHPQLFNVVEEMKIAANLPELPRIYIIDEHAPNAFATGKSPKKSAIAVTAGLLSLMNRDELQGVIAHEMSHVLNSDVNYMTRAAVMLGCISLISEFFIRFTHDAQSSRRYRGKTSSSVSGNQVLIYCAALLFAVLGPVLARVFYFAISRNREYLADASAVRLTRYPEGLAAALEKISERKFKTLFAANEITAPLYIENPLEGKGSGLLSGLMNTHPPIDERVRILREMTQGASFSNYEEAFKTVRKSAKGLIPASGLREEQTLPLREACSDVAAGVDLAVSPNEKQWFRETGDLMRAVNQFAFLFCSCGLKVKLPPDYAKKEFACPRCGHSLVIPSATPATETVDSQYLRKGNVWESFTCSCGGLVQLAPSFQGSRVTCRDCAKVIKVLNPQT